MALEFHPQLGERPSGHYGYLPEQPRLDQSGRMENGVMGADAERFYVTGNGVPAPGHFSDGAGEIAAAALVPVAGRLFRTADDEIDLRRFAVGEIDQIPERQKCRSLGHQIFHQNERLQRLVFVMMPLKTSDQDILMIERQRSVLVYFLPDLVRRLSLTQLLKQIGGITQAMLCNRRQHDFGQKPVFQPDQVVGGFVRRRLQESVELLLRHDLPERAGTAEHAVAIQEMLEPRLFQRSERVRLHVPDKDLIGSVTHGFRVGPQSASYFSLEVRMLFNFP